MRVSRHILSMVLTLQRLNSILEISIEQYKKHKKLLNDLAETKCKLADRKDIEKAKVPLIQMHGLTEIKHLIC